MRIKPFIATAVVLFLVGTAAMPCSADNQPAAQNSEGRGLRGFLCDPEGNPLPDATVLVCFQKFAVDGEGTFFVPHEKRIKGVSSWLVMAQVKKDGKTLSCARFVDYVTGKENITFRLNPSTFLGGRVLSPEGEPIEGAKIVALMDVGMLNCHGTNPVGTPTQTDAAGQFRLVDLYPGAKYMLRVTCPKRERKTTSWISAAGDRSAADVKVTLREAPGFIAGRVTDEKGAPIAKERVILGHPCNSDAVSITDAEGKFRIEDLIPNEEATLSVRWNFKKVKVGANDVVLVIKNHKP